MAHRGLGGGEGALEVHPDDRVPVGLGHAPDGGVAGDAGVVDHDVETTEQLDGLGHHAGRALDVGHVLVVGRRRAATGFDQVHGQIGGAALAVARLAGQRHAEVVHQDGGALLGQLEGVAPADAVPRARHDRHLAVQQAHEVASPDPYLMSRQILGANRAESRRAILTVLWDEHIVGGGGAEEGPDGGGETIRRRRVGCGCGSGGCVGAATSVAGASCGRGSARVDPGRAEGGGRRAGGEGHRTGRRGARDGRGERWGGHRREEGGIGGRTGVRRREKDGGGGDGRRRSRGGSRGGGMRRRRAERGDGRLREGDEQSRGGGGGSGLNRGGQG